MMRSLWTAASGMTSQQMNVDTISNNLANVNTTAYKKERLEFKSLLYQNMERATLDPANSVNRPVNLQVGLGVRPIATGRIYDTGNFERTENKLDFAIEGNGFFSVQRGEDEIAYTKDGSFKLSIVEDGAMLVTSEGYPILSTDLEPITIPTNVMISAINVSEDGKIGYTDNSGEFVDLGVQFDLVQFSNTQGLLALGGNLLSKTPATGEEMHEIDGEVNKTSRLVQGVLEMSNVQVAEEMVKLIVAQRAYELNSKAIQTSDDMLQLANNLKK